MNTQRIKILSLAADHAPQLVVVAWKGLVILALILVANAVWRRGTAAARHLAWSATFLCLLCLPFVEQHLPAWHPPAWIVPASANNGVPETVTLASTDSSAAKSGVAPATANATTKLANSTENAPSATGLEKPTTFNWRGWLVIFWLTGISVGMLRWLVVHLRLHRLTHRLRRCDHPGSLEQLEHLRAEFQIRPPVQLLVADAAVTPFTWGFWQPVVIMPAESRDWPAECMQIVLRHELAHIRRCDWLTQEIAHATCLLYWFNPLVWLARSRLRAEREKACDDFVLNAGARPTEYAGHLVEIARQFVGAPQWGGAVAMARPSGLEQRVLAILDKRRNRNRLANATALAIVAAVFSLALVVGSYAAENLPPAWSLKTSQVAEQLKRFVAEKQAQERQLFDADQKNFAEEYPNSSPTMVVPDCTRFFVAAGAGDWPAVTNSWVDLEAHTLGLSQVTNGYPHGMWLQPMRETFGAIEAFAVGNEKYSKAFADGVIPSIPPGSVYFGGTEHGRFIITALQKSHVQGDPFFTLTQNALVDRTYTDFLRSTYGTNIYIPTSKDSQRCFEDYMAGAQARLKEGKLKPGEDIKVTDGRVQVSGVTAVMEINALLVKIIFDKHPGREFFIEESYPLDWMYPNLEPHGFIFKINRKPLAELSDVTMQQDRAHWQKVVSGAIGDWLKDDTSVQEVAAFAEKVFVRHDLHGFTGDPGFVQNDYSRRMFSKLRNSIAGLYAWRAEHAAGSGEKARMTRAADFAFRQAVALCPVSSDATPDAINNYAAFLQSQHRDVDAREVQSLAKRFKSAGISLFQMRRVVDETAVDAERMTSLSTNVTTGQVRQETLFVAKKVLLDQKNLQSAKMTTGYRGEPQVEFTLTSAGRGTFAQITRELLHQRIAIIVDGRVMSAPNIQSEITSGLGQITGSFSVAEAAALAEKLNAAAGK